MRSLVVAGAVTAIFVAALAAMLFISVPAELVAADATLATATPTATASSTPAATSQPWTFTGTAFVTPSVHTTTVGQMIVVTTTYVTSGTCSFSVYDVTLSQTPHDLFDYIEPPTAVIGHPGKSPAVWKIQARQSGVLTFTVSYYGEIYCLFWQWQYVTGKSDPVTVYAAVQSMPYVRRAAD